MGGLRPPGGVTGEIEHSRNRSGALPPKAHLLLVYVPRRFQSSAITVSAFSDIGAVPPASNRPYFQVSIAQLESLFDQAGGDIGRLQALADELDHRESKRAASLRDHVAGRLRNARADAQARPPERHEFPPTAAPPPSKPMNRPLLAADSPQGILSAWTALEALSPQTFRRPEDLAMGDRSCVADLDKGGVPWGRGERSRPKYRLYYQLVLGTISMDRATADLVAAFGQDEERTARSAESAVIAAIMIDRDGMVLDDVPAALSSFAWALPRALRLELHDLGDWEQVQGRLSAELTRKMCRTDADGKALPVDMPTIRRAFDWLVAELHLPAPLITPPGFVIRVHHYFKAKAPPEPALLNSFYLGDLARAQRMLRDGCLPQTLQSYLGLDTPAETSDVLNDHAATERALAPALFPAAKWPAPGGFPLVSLQQAAVNAARAQLRTGGLIAVNGPPGTGKTTLLRDMIAACVLDRALVMAEFDDPQQAFTPSGAKFAEGDKAFFHLYRLDPRLKGFEILVASSNNKAVENISKELPAKKAMGRADYPGYFRSIADCVFNPPDGDDHSDAAEPLETWGLIAAVLGNSRNRAAFQKQFWWNPDYGFRLYLKAAKGDSVIQDIKNADGMVTERRIPAFLSAENPPDPQQAAAAWGKARARLKTLHAQVLAEFEDLEQVRRLCLEAARLKARAQDARILLEEATKRIPVLQSDHAQAVAALATAEESHGPAAQHCAQLQLARPDWLSRLIRTAAWRQWTSTYAPVAEREAALRQHRDVCRNVADRANQSLQAAQQRKVALEQQLKALSDQYAAAEQTLSRRKSDLVGCRVDAEFFAQGHDGWNKAAPWATPGLHAKREELFLAALDVHRAFIHMAAQKFLHNLSILMSVLANGAPQDPDKRALLGEVWSTLFLVVPVLSTTFASVERMLGCLPSASLGWLLIDEAGQALPQAAIGAVMRAKRCMIVGDPLQIPPVASLPERLNAEICTYFKVSTSLWAAPDASVQTLADRASPYQSEFKSDQGMRRVGMPLLVHRRCLNPMFGISNRIAYDDQMVYAARPDDTARIGRALGDSCWFDVDGQAETKWCPAEGEIVVEALEHIAALGIRDPDLFIITPFRIVAQEMRRRLERETHLHAALGITFKDWAYDRIGTIHTVQGREAEAVFLVLGAPMQSQQGARAWAAGTPNILNVAVSRAKQNLYVVGSHAAWSGIGHARELAHPSALPKKCLLTA